MGKRNLVQHRLQAHHLKLCLIWSNSRQVCMWTARISQTQKWQTTLELWGFVWGKGSSLQYTGVTNSSHQIQRACTAKLWTRLLFSVRHIPCNISNLGASLLEISDAIPRVIPHPEAAKTLLTRRPQCEKSLRGYLRECRKRVLPACAVRMKLRRCVWRHSLVSTLTSSRIKPLVNFLYLWSSLTNSHWWCFGRPTKLLSPWFLVAFCAKSCSSFLEGIPLWFIILYILSHLYWRLRIGSRVFDEISCEQCRRVSINWHQPTSPRSRVRCNVWWESMTRPFFLEFLSACARADQGRERVWKRERAQSLFTLTQDVQFMATAWLHKCRFTWLLRVICERTVWRVSNVVQSARRSWF